MSDMNTPTPDGKAPRRWLGPAFLASVVVNVFLVALISVPLFFRPHDRGFGPPPDSHGPAMMHSALKALPEEDRQVIRRAMKEQFREIVPHIRESQAARDALTEAIAADPYDEAAVRAAFDDMSEAMTAMTEVGRDAMLDAFARLTPEQRQRVAEAMRDERRKMRTRWRDRMEERRSGSGDMPPPPE